MYYLEYNELPCILYCNMFYWRVAFYATVERGLKQAASDKD